MPVFNNIEAIKRDIIKKSEKGIEQAQDRIYKFIDMFLKEYYNEYDPKVYERTEQLLNSLVKSKVVSSGNGYVAEVYFDIDKLDYSMKKVGGKLVPNHGWSEEETLASAARGEHGGYVVGTAIWSDPIAYLPKEAYDILKRELIKAGIPLK